MPYPNFTTADFTPSTTDGVFNIANPLGNSEMMDILPDRATMLASPYNIAESSLPNTDPNITKVTADIGALLHGLPEVIAETYRNDNNALVKDSDLANAVVSDKLRANAQYIRGYWTAAVTLASWFTHQKLGKQGPGSTYENPLTVPFNAAQKARFIGDLGCNPDPNMLHEKYEDKARWDPAVNNTFFNLGYGNDAFSWNSEGGLCLRDTYVFEGFGDFGVAPDNADVLNWTPSEWVVWLAKSITITIVIGGTATVIAVRRQILKTVLNQFGLDLGDDNRPFRNHADSPLNGLLGGNPQVGNVADMHIRTCWSPQDIATHNPCLFAAAMQAGLIPEHVLTMVKAEKGMGGNSNGLPGMTDNAPVNGCNNPTDVIGSPPAISFGGAATYVKPFTSWLQMVDDANFKLGPYAKVGSLPGRLVLITDSPGFGEVGFWIQRWDVHNDGSVIAANNYQTKNEWFNSAGKTLLPVRFLHLPDRPVIKTLVATCGYAHGGNQDTVYQTTIPLHTASAGSQTLAALISSATPSSFTLL